MKLIGGLQRTYIKNNKAEINLKRYQRVAIGAVSESKLYTYPVYFKDDYGNEFKEIVLSQFPPKYWHNTFRLKFWIKDKPGITNLIFDFLSQIGVNVYTQESIMTRYNEYFSISVVADMTYYINKINNEFYLSKDDTQYLLDYFSKQVQDKKKFDSIKSKVYNNIKDNKKRTEFDKILKDLSNENNKENIEKLKNYIDKLDKIITDDDYNKFNDLDYKVEKLQQYLIHLFNKNKKLNKLKHKNPTVKKLEFLNMHSGKYKGSENINQVSKNILCAYRIQDKYESLIVDCGNVYLDKDIRNQIKLTNNPDLYYTINSDTDEKYILVRFFENNNIVQIDIEHKAGKYGILKLFSEKIAKFEYNIISSYDRVQNTDTKEMVATSHWIVMLDCTGNENKLLSLLADLETTDNVVKVGYLTISDSLEMQFKDSLKKYKIDKKVPCETKEIKNIKYCYNEVVKSLFLENIRPAFIYLLIFMLSLIISLIFRFSNIKIVNNPTNIIIFLILLSITLLFPFIIRILGHDNIYNGFKLIFLVKKRDEIFNKKIKEFKESKKCNKDKAQQKI